MHPLLTKFANLVSEGTIKDYQPIPNLTFTYEELEYLCNNGYIYESGNKFYALVPNSF